MTTMTVTEARATLPELLDRVATGDEVTITRHGRAVAVVVRPDALRSRRTGPVAAHMAALDEVLDAGRRAGSLPPPGVTAERAEELIAEIRVGRQR